MTTLLIEVLQALVKTYGYDRIHHILCGLEHNFNITTEMIDKYIKENCPFATDENNCRPSLRIARVKAYRAVSMSMGRDEGLRYAKEWIDKKYNY